MGSRAKARRAAIFRCQNGQTAMQFKIVFVPATADVEAEEEPEQQQRVPRSLSSLECGCIHRTGQGPVPGRLSRSRGEPVQHGWGW